MVTYKDCFSREEWEKLMLAKQIPNGAPVKLRYHSPIFSSGPTTYTIYFEDSALTERFEVPGQYWDYTKKVLKQHFNIIEMEYY